MTTSQRPGRHLRPGLRARHGLSRPLFALRDVHNEQVRAWQHFFRIGTSHAGTQVKAATHHAASASQARLVTAAAARPDTTA
ncbi:MAG: hypothetical protein ACM3ML_15895 [Micromonosporaceae bacterium]